MIIDCILDRKEDDKTNYNPAAFYHAVMRYGDIGEDITMAMDYGNEADVKRALCEYIVNNEYSPNICGYIWSVNWLTA